ncbi:DUF4845 domain-containing protein [Sedimenticola thiotaurini]|uniref:DUF4845 domain-containing protein n=1 Tax=Sedimenticola thiotaurini TaxID=1543721 RepID=A0A0F7JWD3_9GAMM|nr:DUF4845 domain-containing protein [Sedimenticola thiotaurini]AKH19659.1 hypothetical protein AAY24_04010 [Sedimenticola thiotaurini]
MESGLKKQKGMTLTGWMTVIALILFFAMLGMKIGPIYLQNLTVKDVVESLKDEPLITKRSSSQVKSMIMKRLDINSVYDLKSDNVTVKKSPGIMKVSIDYQVQKKLVGNMDILVTFSDEIELISN